MPRITILGERLAKKGVVFEYRGYLDECASCKLKGVCHKLEEGHRYRVTGVRDVRHDCCTVFDGDVRVVEVEEVPLVANIPARAARGTAHTHRWEECGVACPFKEQCNPLALSDGDEVELLEVEGDPVVCKVGRDLRRATVRLMD